MSLFLGRRPRSPVGLIEKGASGDLLILRHGQDLDSAVFVPRAIENAGDLIQQEARRHRLNENGDLEIGKAGCHFGTDFRLLIDLLDDIGNRLVLDGQSYGRLVGGIGL